MHMGHEANERRDPRRGIDAIQGARETLGDRLRRIPMLAPRAIDESVEIEHPHSPKENAGPAKQVPRCRAYLLRRSRERGYWSSFDLSMPDESTCCNPRENSEGASSGSSKRRPTRSSTA